MKPRSSCELCGGTASVYCPSDSAFLCAGCDARVHGANFLAARHVRTPIASPCHPCSASSFDPDSDDDDEADDSASSSVRSAASSCISTAESAPSAACRSASGYPFGTSNKRPPPPRSRMRRSPLMKNASNARGAETAAGVDARAEGVLSSWCAVVGAGAFGGSTANCTAVVASHAMAVGLRRLGANVPSRVCAAAAVWFAFKLCCGCGGQQQPLYGQCLRRLEECSGVPARIVAAAESKLSRVVRRRQQLDAEGWAECE